MATIFYKVHFILLVSVLFLIIFSHVRGNYGFKLDNSEDMRTLWKLLGKVSSEEMTSDAENYHSLEDQSELEEKQINYKNFYDRSLNYLNKRTVPFTKCKVLRHRVTNMDDEYTYSPRYYDNLTCEKTNEDPFNVTLPHFNEYCYIFHHPFLSPGCNTMYRNISFFRRRNFESWEPFTQTLSVGCGCSLGFTYVS